MNSLELRKQWAGLVASAREIYDTASADNREPTNVEVSEFDKRMADAEQVKAEIANAERKERLDAEEAELRHVQPRKSTTSYGASKKLSEGEVSEAWRAWALAGSPDCKLTPDQQYRAAECGINLSARSLSLRALSKGTTTAGGYTVPVGFNSNLERTLKYYFNIAGVVNTLNTDSGQDIQLPTEDDTSNAASIVAEAGGIGSSTDMTFGQVTFKAWKYASPIVKVSVELLQDSAIDIPAYLGQAFGERHGRAYDAAAVSANVGSAAPEGILHNVSAGVNLATGNPLTWQKMIDLIHSVDKAYRASPSFGLLMHDATFAALKKLADSQNRPLFLNNLQDGVVAKWENYNIYISNNMTSIDAGSLDNNVLILAGDLSKYTWRTVTSSRQLVRLDELYAANGQVGFVMLERVDGRNRNTGAMKTLNAFDAP